MYPRGFLVAYALVGLFGAFALVVWCEPNNLSFRAAAGVALVAALLGGSFGYANGLVNPALPVPDERQASWPSLVGVVLGLVAYSYLRGHGMDNYVPVFFGFICLSPVLGLGVGALVRKLR